MQKTPHLSRGKERPLSKQLSHVFCGGVSPHCKLLVYDVFAKFIYLFINEHMHARSSTSRQTAPLHISPKQIACTPAYHTCKRKFKRLSELLGTWAIISYFVGFLFCLLYLCSLINATIRRKGVAQKTRQV
jgi:hypothetical protein